MIFHNFTGGDWKIFSGNILMLVTSLCYIAWWTTAFRPGKTNTGSMAPVLITLTLAAGISSLVLLAMGIGELAASGKAVDILYIIAGAFIAYLILLTITKKLLHRPVTSELLIIVIWSAFEFSVLSVLSGNGRLGLTGTVTLITLITAVTVTGIICYILYYKLDGVAGFLDGLIPIAADGLVVAIFLAVQTLS